MDPKHLFADERHSGFCVYCGAEPSTRDHVPSRVLLNKPYPPNLGVVTSCLACNNSASSDEAYLACFLECVIAGSTEAANIERQQIAKLLEENPALRERIRKSVKEEGGALVWTPERDRIERVIVKLARGHAAYDFSVPQLDEPSSCLFGPMLAMSAQAHSEFEDANDGGIAGWPEIGSRAFVRASEGSVSGDANGWIVAQSNSYRYIVDEVGGMRVRIVIREYLACEVCWE